MCPFDILASHSNNFSMECGVEQRHEWTILTINGRSDSFSFPQVRAETERLLADGVIYLAMDLSRTKFLSIATIDFLRHLAASLEERGGQFALVGAAEKIKRNLAIFAGNSSMLVLTRPEELPQMALGQVPAAEVKRTYFLSEDVSETPVG